MRIYAFGFWILVLSGCSSTPGNAPVRSSPESLTIDTLVSIKHPGSAVWAPNSRRLAFIWDRAGVQNVWIADTGPGASVVPKPATSYDSGLIDGVFWSGDSRTLYFARSGDLWKASADGGQPEPVWTTKEIETDLALSPDGTRVAFIRGGTL